MVPEKLKLFKEKLPKYKIKATGEIIAFDWLEKVVAIYQERLKKLSEISELAGFFLRDNLEYETELLKWQNMTDREVIGSLERVEEIIKFISENDWTQDNLEKSLIAKAEKDMQQRKVGSKGELLWPLRVALTGKKASAGPFEVAAILGREKTLKRIKEAMENCRKQHF
ncbi:MAG: hypothetical protein A3H01_00265 [Candidatus Wildermuthbacteria bacterium RIFCSPLOWO2_12_FULL_40_9]|uniref:Aminoacyl-tRNA synthetase class I anticodon-binding domain-containing protein n=2 Tax=Candidatus Wildermuthiibacteriota TaxID=1817923 RepID=A0A1G2RCW5_9BACT|nr:MAG: hypothetical protein A3F15_02245 [Candidatus Wildermuthbacteria bacterium RIFCSPHIGHO2_12_FULL_40_12]OHA76522.1 MAG: hypothetical protein A3H01_00265 [Candidatus Wildermuthbacteria bacterium RIFCSPLOWO2_12_FULL_40_9]